MQLDEWKVVTRSARGPEDMRPIIRLSKPQGEVQESIDKFEALAAQGTNWIGLPDGADVDARMITTQNA